MTIEQFINYNRLQLIEALLQIVPNARYIDDEELEQWIINDEQLYFWAESEGVEI